MQDQKEENRIVAKSRSTAMTLVLEQKEEERIVAKSRPTAMILSSSVPASSSSTENPITSSGLVKLMAAGKPASRTRRNPEPDEAPSSQVKLKMKKQESLFLTKKRGETCTFQYFRNFRESCSLKKEMAT